MLENAKMVVSSRLIASVEAIIREWMALELEEHTVLTASVEHLHKRFTIRYHYGGPVLLPAQLLESSADFSSLAHPLSRWFGVSSFVSVEGDEPNELEECRVLLSALTVALDAVAGEVVLPVFVPFGRARPRDYLGYILRSDSMVQLSSKAAFAHSMPSLKWLLGEFGRRSGFDPRNTGVGATVHCTWKSRMNPHGGWLQPAAISPGSFHHETPWGPELDPVAAVAFSTTTHLQLQGAASAEELQGAGEDPAACSRWSVLCQLDPVPLAPLTDSVRMLLQAMTEADAEGFRTVRQAISDQRLGRALLDPMMLPSRDEVDRMIAELFNPAHPGIGFFDAPNASDWLLDVKSAPPLTLLASLCMYLLNLEGLAGVATIWLEFVRELRSHWDHFTELPRTGLPNGEPHRFCKLFQRLQMLNWCIQQRRDRNETAKKAALGDWGDAEFDNVSSGEEGNSNDDDSKNDNEERRGREGAKERLKVCLLETGAPMFVPETQDAGGVATTEDMLEEQEALLLSLESSEMRAELQSRGLLSDMEAFQAANPQCILEDFVRWHSPKDWVVEGVGKKTLRGKNAKTGAWVYEDKETGKNVRGKLSSRMGDAGNLWDRLWQQANPVPVSRQKPLIDHVREGERILSMFEQMNPFELLQEVVLVAMTTVWHTFQVYPTSQVPIVSRQTTAFAATLIEVGGYRGEFGPEDLAPCVAELEKLESISSYAASLLGKLDNNSDLISSLLGRDGRGSIHVPLDSQDGAVERAVVVAHLARSFAEDESDAAVDESNLSLPPPSEREYLFRYLGGDLSNAQTTTTTTQAMNSPSSRREVCGGGQDARCQG